MTKSSDFISKSWGWGSTSEYLPMRPPPNPVSLWTPSLNLIVSSSDLQWAAVRAYLLLSRTPEQIQFSWSLYIFLPPGKTPANFLTTFPRRIENGNSPGVVISPPTIYRKSMNKNSHNSWGGVIEQTKSKCQLCQDSLSDIIT